MSSKANKGQALPTVKPFEDSPPFHVTLSRNKAARAKRYRKKAKALQYSPDTYHADLDRFI